MKSHLLTISIVFLTACSSVPSVIQTTENASNDPSGGLIIKNPGGNSVAGGNCTDPQTEVHTITPDSSQGANVVLALDDSGSMSNEIAHVVSVIDQFIQDLVLATDDNLRLVLLFSMTGDGPNGSAFPSGAANPFQNVIDNQRVFYVNQITGSRGSDIAMYKAFSTSGFQQLLPSVVPSDAGNVSAASCTGAGKYFRPRALIPELWGGADAGLNQTPQGCITSPGISSVAPNGTIGGPLSKLLPGVSVNFISVSDDDNNVAGDFLANPYNGADLVLNMLRKSIEPLGANLPVYYHSIVGLTNNSDPAFPGSNLARIGTKHAAMSLRTQGLIEDIRQTDYNSVFEHLTQSIIYSEQVVATECEFKPAIVPSVTLNGSVLSADKYEFTNGLKQLRLLPSAFDGMPSGALTLRIDY